MGRTISQPSNGNDQSGISESTISDQSNSITEFERNLNAPISELGNQPEGISGEGGTNETTSEGRPKRGRPKGSSNRPKENLTFGVQESKTRKQRSIKEPERKLYTPQEAKELTDVILGAIELIGQSMIGEQGKFNGMEDYLLTSSFPKLLERMSPTAADKTANFLYPLMIGFAGVSYGARILRTARLQQEHMPDSIQQPMNENSPGIEGKYGDNNGWNSNPNWSGRIRDR